MKSTAKKVFLFLAMFALAAAIGFTFVSCEDDPYYGYGDGYTGGSSGRSLTGTYVLSGYDSGTITFYSDRRYSGYDWTSRSGSYTFDGSYIYLSTGYVAGVDDFYYYTSYLRDEDGRTWNRR